MENRLWNNKKPRNSNYVGGSGDPVGPVTLPDGRVILPKGATGEGNTGLNFEYTRGFNFAFHVIINRVLADLL